MIIFGTSSALKPFLVELSDGEFGREFSHPPENQPFLERERSSPGCR
jgi:hypothetical protein